MKRVLYDLLVAQPKNGSKFHGGGEYVKTLFKRLLVYKDVIKIEVCFNSKEFIDYDILELLDKNRITVHDVSNHKALDECGLLNEIDIYVCGLSEPIINLHIPEKTKVVTIYHGIRALEKPIDITSCMYSDNTVTFIKDFLKFLAGEKYRKFEKKKIKKAFDKSDYLVGVSNSAVCSVKSFFPDIDSSKLLLAYAPLKKIEKCEGAKVNKEKVVLMLGGDRWIKNAYRGIKSLDQLFSNKQMNDYSVNIIGNVSNKIKKRIKNKEKFRFFDYLTSEDLEIQYKNCDFLFYPTMNEGFGYPPLEAMKYGKTCVVSSVSSLPEIYGESVYYCNPYDVYEMMARLLFASDNKISHKLIFERYNYLDQLGAQSIEDLCDRIVRL